MYRNPKSKNHGLLIAAMPIALLILFALFAQFDAPQTLAQQEATRTPTSIIAATATATIDPLPELQRSRDEYASIAHALQAQNIAAQSPFLAYALAMEAGRIENPPAEAYRSLLSMVYDTRALTSFSIAPASAVTLAFTDDGNIAAVLTYNSQLLIIDRATGEVLHSYIAPRGYIAGADFTPDGSKLILTIPDNNLLVVWDVATGRTSRIAAGEPFSLVEVSPDGEKLLLASFYASELVLWDLTTREELIPLESYGYTATEISFSPDGNLALVGYYDGRLMLLDLTTGEILREIYVGGSPVTALAYSPLGNIAAVGLENGGLIIVNIANGGIYLNEEFAHTGAINDLTFDENGFYLVTGGSDKRVVVWDMEFGARLYELTGHQSAVMNVAYNTDGSILSGDNTGNFISWDTLLPYDTLNYYAHPAAVWSAAFSPDGRYAATGGADGGILVWDAATGQTLLSLSGHTGYVYGLEFTPDGHYLLSGSGDGRGMLWDVATGEQLVTFPVNESQINNVAISPDGSTAALGTWNAGVWLFDIDPESETFGEELIQLEPIEGSLYGIAFSPDGSTMTTGTDTGQLIMWDAETGEEIQNFDTDGNLIKAIVYQADGERIATLERSSDIVIRDIASGQVLRTISLQNNIYNVAFSPDGRTILSYSEASISLWNADSGQLIRTYDRAFSENITDITFSADGRHFMATSVDASVRLWTLPSVPELMDTLLTQRYVPAFTCEQRLAYRVEPYCDVEGSVPTQAPFPTLTATPAATDVRGSVEVELELLPTSTPASTAVMVEQTAHIGTQRGETEVGGGEVWLYNGSYGEVLDILVTADEPANDNENREDLYDTYLIVRSPLGRIIYIADDINDGIVTDSAIYGIILPTTGVYEIEVRSWNDESGGAYSLEINSTPYSTPTPFQG